MHLAKALLACLMLSIPGISDGASPGVIVLVDAHVKPGKREAVLQGFRRSQASCPQWKGCRRFEISLSADDPDHVVLIEHWDSIELHQSEVAVVMGRERFNAFRNLLERDLAFRYLHVQ